jgi:hypothetical protein
MEKYNRFGDYKVQLSQTFKTNRNLDFANDDSIEQYDNIMKWTEMCQGIRRNEAPPVNFELVIFDESAKWKKRIYKVLKFCHISCFDKYLISKKMEFKNVIPVNINQDARSDNNSFTVTFNYNT